MHRKVYRTKLKPERRDEYIALLERALGRETATAEYWENLGVEQSAALAALRSRSQQGDK